MTSDPGERRLQNLEAVARHRAAGFVPAPASPVSDATGTTGEAEAKRTPRSGIWKTLGPVGLVLAFILGKGKLLLPLLKFAKLHTLLTMLLAVWVYAQLWGFAFALGFVLLIFVHEMGHAVAMRQQGLAASAPVFIPFVGAVIAMKSVPKNAYVEAVVGIGGPILGSIGAFVCLVVGWLTGSLFWYALASTGFLINLFNMIPISPLDGGRIVGVLSRWIWVVGYAIGITVFLLTFHPLLLVILLLGLFGLGRAIRGPREGYFDVEPQKRLGIGVAYFALLALLSVGMWVADRPLEDLRTPRPETAAHTTLV